MLKVSRRDAHLRPSLPFALLVLFSIVLLLAGGASHAGELGQVIVRIVAMVVLIISALFGPRLSLDQGRAVSIFLAASVVLAGLQLVPLPPAVWQMLPGRNTLAQAAILTGQPQPWRPLAIVPGAAINALASLIVPLTVLVLALGVREAERMWLPGLLLGLIVTSMLVSLLQFTGGGFDNPLINDSIGQVSSTFANRNHFALFLALGCLLAPPWAFLRGRRPGWRGPVALGLIVLFVLTILAVGSRGGLVVGVLALGFGVAMVQRRVRKVLDRFSRWTFPAVLAVFVGVVAAFVLLSVEADRAVSVSRVFADDPGQDMRSRGLPTVMAMIAEYFPVGSGFGGFDPLFRMHEPFALLKPTYFNHAHNDWLEVVLDAGIAGLGLLVAFVIWWLMMSIRAWRAEDMLPKLGSAMLLLVMISSVFDYPARTPMIMMVVVLAGLWLGCAAPRSPALPKIDQHL